MNNFKEELEKAKEELGMETDKIEENYDAVGEETGLTQILKVNGKPILFDFGTLTGNSILEVKEQYRKIKRAKAAVLEEFDDLYYMLVAQKVTGISYKQFLDLKYKEYNAIKVAVRDFLSED